MARGDLGLQAVRARAPRPLGQDGQSLVDHDVIPTGAVLFLEQHEVARLVGPGRATRVLEQHEREQGADVLVPGEQSIDESRQPDRLVAQLRSEQLALGRRVSLVEHQVEHREHAVDTLRQELAWRHTVGDRGVADLALRPGEALRQGGLRNEERPRDLAGRQSGDRPQGQRDPGVHRERRVATGEEEP